MEVVRKWLAELLDNNPEELLQISLSLLTGKEKYIQVAQGGDHW